MRKNFQTPQLTASKGNVNFPDPEAILCVRELTRVQ